MLADTFLSWLPFSLIFSLIPFLKPISSSFFAWNYKLISSFFGLLDKSESDDFFNVFEPYDLIIDSFFYNSLTYSSSDSFLACFYAIFLLTSDILLCLIDNVIIGSASKSSTEGLSRGSLLKHHLITRFSSFL